MIIQSGGNLTRMQAYSPTDDYWYNPVDNQAASGMYVNDDTAMKISAVWACVGLIADMIGTMPIKTYERIGDRGDRRDARDYYIYEVLHDRPNPYQTPFEFKAMLQVHLLLRGNGYARIKSGRKGFAEQLIPLHPDNVKPERMKDGSIRYKVKEEDGTHIYYNDEDIFHLRGHTRNGLEGMSVIQYGRESFGLALAAESYGTRFYSQDATPGGILEHPGKLLEPTRKALKEAWESAHSGVRNAHRVAILEEGMKWHQMSISPEDAQALETRQFQVADIARWFRVPLHMIQEETKSTSWGTGIEQLSQGFVTFTLLPWATRWQQAITRDLIINISRYYAEFLTEVLVKGDLKTRYEAYSIARQWGWLSVNDIRRKENENPVDNGDVYLEPLNMKEAGTLTPEPIQPAIPANNTGQGNAHYQLLVREAAARIIRKEIAAMSKAAKRCAADSDEWVQAVDDFYADHAPYVVRNLAVSQSVAEVYVREQREALQLYGARVMDDWEISRVEDLVALFLGGQQDAA